VAPNDVHHVGAGQKLLDEVLGNAHVEMVRVKAKAPRMFDVRGRGFSAGMGGVFQ
jgi:hypothetical protein